MHLIKIVRIGSKRQEELLERLCVAVEKLIPQPPDTEEATVEFIDKVQMPKEEDESEM